MEPDTLTAPRVVLDCPVAVQSGHFHFLYCHRLRSGWRAGHAGLIGT